MDAILIIIIAYGLLWNNSIIWHKASINLRNPKMHSSIYMMSFSFFTEPIEQNMENKYQECKI